MPAVAIIPARGGSKGLPRKNVRLLCGKPLIAWTIEAALQARAVDRVVVSTDDAEIAEVSRRWGAEVVERPPEISTDTSPSEAALLHALAQLRLDQGTVAFLQCTSPLTLPEDIDGTVGALAHADTAFTATISHRFLWRDDAGEAMPIGHSKTYRPRRQEREKQFVEVGAVYAMRIEGFLRSRHRFFGRTVMHVIPPERSLEIDDEIDFLLAETLMRRRLERAQASLLPAKVHALVMDFDGVLTDNRVLVDENGREAVTCHRGDGWAIKRLREAGVRLLVLTNESNPSVRRRCEKLAVECLTVNGPKLPVLADWLNRHGVAPLSTLYVGNDDPDIPCLRHVGCGVVPADASAGAKSAAQIVLATAGGHGCIRALTELLTTACRLEG